MRALWILMGCLLCALRPSLIQAESATPVYAVVTAVPKDFARIPAKIVIEGVVSDTILLPTEAIQNNLIWKKLEICHAMRIDGKTVADGFEVTWVRVVNAAMLPMALQGFTGDCLIKKALEVAPLDD